MHAWTHTHTHKHTHQGQSQVSPKSWIFHLIQYWPATCHKKCKKSNDIAEHNKFADKNYTRRLHVRNDKWSIHWCEEQYTCTINIGKCGVENINKCTRRPEVTMNAGIAVYHPGTGILKFTCSRFMAVWMLLVSGSCRDTTETCPLPNNSAKGVLAKPLQSFPIRPSLTATLLLLSQFVTVWAWRVRSILGVEGRDKSKEYRPYPEMHAAEVNISRKQ